MTEGVSEILESHVRLGQRQLDLMRAGTDFSIIDRTTPWMHVVPTTKSGMVQHLANLKITLARHIEPKRSTFPANPANS